MKTKLLRKIRKRFDYKFEKNDKMKDFYSIVLYDKKKSRILYYKHTRGCVISLVRLFYGSLFADRDTKTDKRKRLKMFNKINN